MNNRNSIIDYLPFPTRLLGLGFIVLALFLIFKMSTLIIILGFIGIFILFIKKKFQIDHQKKLITKSWSILGLKIINSFYLNYIEINQIIVYEVNYESISGGRRIYANISPTNIVKHKVYDLLINYDEDKKRIIFKANPKKDIVLKYAALISKETGCDYVIVKQNYKP